jgi:hypothetical protein
MDDDIEDSPTFIDLETTSLKLIRYLCNIYENTPQYPNHLSEKDMTAPYVVQIVDVMVNMANYVRLDRTIPKLRIDHVNEVIDFFNGKVHERLTPLTADDMVLNKTIWSFVFSTMNINCDLQFIVENSVKYTNDLMLELLCALVGWIISKKVLTYSGCRHKYENKYIIRMSLPKCAGCCAVMHGRSVYKMLLGSILRKVSAVSPVVATDTVYSPVYNRMKGFDTDDDWSVRSQLFGGSSHTVQIPKYPSDEDDFDTDMIKNEVDKKKKKVLFPSKFWNWHDSDSSDEGLA